MAYANLRADAAEFLAARWLMVAAVSGVGPKDEGKAHIILLKWLLQPGFFSKWRAVGVVRVRVGERMQSLHRNSSHQDMFLNVC
jgi:hypothetical protein